MSRRSSRGPRRRHDERLWVITLRPSAGQLAESIAGLETRGYSPVLVEVEQVRPMLQTEEPALALVHGGTLTSTMLEVQRWLTRAAVPTMILVEDLVDTFEASLLDRGAHDVVSLPASARVIASRVDTVLRLAAHPSRRAGTIRLGQDLVVDVDRRTVQVHHTQVPLSRTEFDLLHLLAVRNGRVVTRTDLARALGRPTMSGRALESHMSRLRIRLRRAGSRHVPRAVRGVGYVLGTGVRSTR